jgi:hypothetical protein
MFFAFMLLCQVMYPRYRGPPVMAQNSGYVRFPPATNGREPYTLYQEMTPLLQVEEGGTNLKRTNLRNDSRHHFSTL